MAEDNVVNLTVRAQDGNELKFKVRKTTPFQKVFNAYCGKVGLEQELMRFIFDQQRLRPEQTPEEVEMEDGDVIEAMVQQLGGGC